MSRPGSPAPSDSGSAEFTSVVWAHDPPSAAAAPPSTSAGPAATPSSPPPPTSNPLDPLSSRSPARPAHHAADGSARDASTPVEADLDGAAAGADAFATATLADAVATDEEHADVDGPSASSSAGGGHGWVGVRIVDYKKELEGGKESYVSYGLRTKVSQPASPLPRSPSLSGSDDALLYRPAARRQTTLSTYPVQDVKVRRRFQDFTFLSDQLTKDFPACIVPPLPSKSRIGPCPVPSPAVLISPCYEGRREASSARGRRARAMVGGGGGGRLREGGPRPQALELTDPLRPVYP